MRNKKKTVGRKERTTKEQKKQKMRVFTENHPTYRMDYMDTGYLILDTGYKYTD